MDLASRFRPTNIDEMIGQQKIVEVFKKFLKEKRVPHSLFFGTPGSGKTSLARLIASTLGAEFYEFDGANFKTEQIRSIIGKNPLFVPLIFIDEFHRLSRTQQEALLIPVENGECLLFGATTENPKFSISSGIRSRMMIFEFEPLSSDDLSLLLERVKAQIGFSMSPEAREYLLRTSGGDARSMLNLLDYALIISADISLEVLMTLRGGFVGEGAKSSDTHYEIISAMIKSVRGSDADASIYYLARLLAAGEDPAFLARRMVILASEDIGNANPNALNLAVSCMNAVLQIGMPEARIILAQTIIYLANCPKSNSAYLAIDEALEACKDASSQRIPKQIINHTDENKGYLYPHDFGGWVGQQYLPDALLGTQFYKPKLIAFEKTLAEWSAKIKGEF